MENHLIDWVSMLLRRAHIITGVAWISASFYSVSLDNNLAPPKNKADVDKGVGAEQWVVHGGGFYHHQKYPVSPGHVPDQLLVLLASWWQRLTAALPGRSVLS
jgi:uncharacterized membrane protein